MRNDMLLITFEMIHSAHQKPMSTEFADVVRCTSSPATALGSLFRQISWAICTGRKRFKMGTNQQPAAHPDVWVKWRAPRGSRLAAARGTQITKTIALTR